MKTYVIPDIHGHLDLLEKALNEITKRKPAKIIFTGDYIDRGPASSQVVSLLMKGPPDGWKWELIRGNHEDMMIQCYQATPYEVNWWYANGGNNTMESYFGTHDLIKTHIEWMKTLPRLLWDKHRVYTHAGVHNSHPLDQQPEEITQWYRYPKNADVGYKYKDNVEMHVVHGHTPVEDGPELFVNRTNLDTGSFFTGRLVVGVFDDDKAGGPVEIIEVT